MSHVLRFSLALLLCCIGCRNAAKEEQPQEQVAAKDPEERTQLEEDVEEAAESLTLMQKLSDPEDGKLDLSRSLEDPAGFLPVGLPVTEPALGFGGAVALMFFHQKPEKEGPDGKMVRTKPSISFVGGMGTDNGTWAVFGGHSGSWKDDRIRYLGFAAYAAVNLDFYGPSSEFGGRGFAFHIEGVAIVQSLSFRIGGSPIFIGADYNFFGSDVTFAGALPPGLDPMSTDSTTAGVGFHIRYDTRGIELTPDNGLAIGLSVTFWDEAFGGDFAYETYGAYLLWFKQVHPQIVIGLRLDGQFSEGRLPFYALPFLRMRGLPALRYQGDNAVLAEIEVRWDFTPRWSLVAFAGAGRTASDFGELSDVGDELAVSESVQAFGGGFRYLLARKFGLRLGIDVAVGPEKTVFYVTVGTAWMRP